MTSKTTLQEANVAGYSEVSERRVSARTAADLDGRLRSAHTGSLPCCVKDIGYSGACIETTSILATEDVRELSLSVDCSTLILDVRGCWQRYSAMEDAWLMGLRFTSLDSKCGDAVHELIRQARDDLARFLIESTEVGVLAPDAAFDIASAMRFRRLDAGRRMSLQPAGDSESESWYIVFRGALVIETFGGSRAPARVELGVGDTFGGAAIVSRIEVASAAWAREDSALLEVSVASLEYLTNSKPEASRTIHQLIAESSIQLLRSVMERRPSASSDAQ